MKCLVTGGAGFIGSNIVQFLRENGHEVTVLDNLTSGYKVNLQGLGAKFVRGDVRDAALVQELVRGVAVVSHLAASVGNKRSNPLIDSSLKLASLPAQAIASRMSYSRTQTFFSSGDRTQKSNQGNAKEAQSCSAVPVSYPPAQ